MVISTGFLLRLCMNYFPKYITLSQKICPFTKKYVSVNGQNLYYFVFPMCKKIYFLCSCFYENIGLYSFVHPKTLIMYLCITNTQFIILLNKLFFINFGYMHCKEYIAIYSNIAKNFNIYEKAFFETGFIYLPMNIPHKKEIFLLKMQYLLKFFYYP